MELGNMIFGHSRGIYPVPRGYGSEVFGWEDRFQEFLERINCDHYGYANSRDSKYLNDRGGITTKLFAIYPYWWGDPDDEVECEKPNFHYFPDSYELHWYKYPLRDAYANKRLSFEEFDLMLKDCEEFYNG